MIDALEILRETTRSTPWEGKLYLVGGVLRDRLLGLPEPEDLDIVLEEDAVELADFLHRQGVSDHHPVVYPRFGTAKLAVRGHDVEIVSARAESYEPDNRKPSVVRATLEDDAYRRDFTINTLMENIHSGERLDLTGRGVEDLRAGIVRTPLDPHVTFFDDPLRMLRAIRFACRHGFVIDPATWRAIGEMAGRLSLFGPDPPVVSAERIRDEFLKMVTTDGPVLDGPIPAESISGRGASMALSLLRRAGLLDCFLPELSAMAGVTQNAWHPYDVWDHTLVALSHVPAGATLEVRLGILFHDVGKPPTRSEDEKGIHFYEHQFVGARMTREALHRLKLTNDEIHHVSSLVELHMRLGDARPDWTDASVRRLIRALHPYTEELFVITRCDQAAIRQDVPHGDLAPLRARMDALNAQMNAARVESPLDGREIMALLGVEPGPILKQAKEHLVNLLLDGTVPEGDKRAARTALEEWFARGAGEQDR